jgi:hypothetical protein
MGRYSPRHLGGRRGARSARSLGVAPLLVGAILVVVMTIAAAVIESRSPPPAASRQGAPTSSGGGSRPKAPNLLANAGFDQDLTGWRALPGTFLVRIRPQPVEEPDAWVARLQRDPGTRSITDPTTGQAQYGMSAPLLRVVSAGARLRLSARVRSLRPGVQVLLRATERAGAASTVAVEHRARLGDTAWHPLEIEGDVRSANARIEVEVVGLGLDPETTLWVDDVTVVRVS